MEIKLRVPLFLLPCITVKLWSMYDRMFKKMMREEMMWLDQKWMVIRQALARTGNSTAKRGCLSEDQLEDVIVQKAQVKISVESVEWIKRYKSLGELELQRNVLLLCMVHGCSDMQVPKPQLKHAVYEQSQVTFVFYVMRWYSRTPENSFLCLAIEKLTLCCSSLLIVWTREVQWLPRSRYS